MEAEAISDRSQDAFYQKAANYWEQVPATVEGMLGGFGFISKTDIEGSKRFLNDILQWKVPPRRTYALDCGAGIGRITQNFLIHLFDKVDLVEQNPKFLETAKVQLATKHGDSVGHFYPLGLQDFFPEPDKYDVIWCQWVSGHLKDQDFIDFFTRCIKGLRKNGVIIVKENVTSSGKVEKDDTDSSVTRPLAVLRRLFRTSGLKCREEFRQTDFPKGLYAVYMFALTPKEAAVIDVPSDNMKGTSTDN